MNCNGVGGNLVIVVLLTLTCTMTQWCNAMYRIEWNDDSTKSRRNTIGRGDYKQLYGNRFENIGNEIFDDIPRKDNQIDGATAITKRSTIENCLYEELKRRVDKFNNDLAKNPNTALKDHIDDLYIDNQKRSAVRECLYDAYKKRLDDISNQLKMDGAIQSDRTGRSSSMIQHTYEDLARRLQLLSQSLQPENNAQQSPAASVALKRSAAVAAQPWDYEDTLVEDRDLDNDNDEEIVYDDDNTRLFMNVPINGAASSSTSTDINASSYPAVLTKAFEANMNPITKASPGNLLASVAQKMNTTTLELAQKLTNLTENDTTAMSNDPTLTATLQKYITRTVGVNTTISQPSVSKQDTVDAHISAAEQKASDANQKQEARQPKSALNLFSFKGNSSTKSPSNSSEEQCEEEKPKNATDGKCNMNPIVDNPGEIMNDENSNRITMILEKVLSKLENLEAKKENASRKSASTALEGAPCELLGSWHSLGMGVRFDITLGKATERQLGTAEEGNKLLAISVEECIPPKRKRIVDTDWKFMGSGMQQLGGPFYMYSQRRKDKLLATFTGFCRTCGGIDTIFGSWTFLFPTKDCQDISAAIDNRRDIFRRYKLEVKRKQRFKELLYKNSKMGKTESCKDKDS